MSICRSPGSWTPRIVDFSGMLDRAGTIGAVGVGRRLKLENCDGQFSPIGRPPSSFNNYWDTSPFDASLMVGFRKRFGEEGLSRIGKVVAMTAIQEADADSEPTDDDGRRPDYVAVALH